MTQLRVWSDSADGHFVLRPQGTNWPIWFRYEVSRRYKVSRVRSGKGTKCPTSNLPQWDIPFLVKISEKVVAPYGKLSLERMFSALGQLSGMAGMISALLPDPSPRSEVFSIPNPNLYLQLHSQFTILKKKTRFISLIFCWVITN